MKPLVLLLPALCACAATQTPPAWLPAVCRDNGSVEPERCAAALLSDIWGDPGPLAQDEQLAAYVTQVGRRVAAQARAPDHDFRFHILETDQLKAQARLGDNIDVSTAMLAQLDSEAELAFILAHEIGHIVSGHTHLDYNDRSASWSTGREDISPERLGDRERLADELGLLFAANAGYASDAAKAFFLRADHAAQVAGTKDPAYYPPTPVRVARLERLAAEHAGGRAYAERYRRATDQMLAGPNPRQGKISGRAWMHANAGVALSLPKGWQAVSLGSAMVMSPRQGGVFARWAPLPASELVRRAFGFAGARDRTVLGRRATTSSLVTDVLAAAVAPLTSGCAHATGLMIPLDGRDWMLLVCAPTPQEVAHTTELVLAGFHTIEDTFPAWAPRRLAFRETHADQPMREAILDACGDAPDDIVTQTAIINGIVLTEPVGKGQRIKCLIASPTASSDAAAPK